jgi:hypothetical protein
VPEIAAEAADCSNSSSAAKNLNLQPTNTKPHATAVRIQLCFAPITRTFNHRGTNCLNSVCPIVRTLGAVPSDDVEKSAWRDVLGIFVVIVATNAPFR